MAAQIMLVPREAFECSPSMKDGVSCIQELQQRAYGCQLMQKAGVLLSLQAVTIASGQAIFHRFYFRRSLRSFDVRKIAASSLWLACKIEEDPRRVLHLVNVFHFLELLEKHPEAHIHLESMDKESLDPFILEIDSTIFKEFRAELVRCERYVLRELGFMVSQTLVHPHRFILHYIHALFKSTPQVETSRLCQIAWGYLNDSMVTVLCCEVQPAVIAVGSIFLAASDLEIPLPEEIRWYELFDVTWDDVVKVCSTIRESYTWPAVEYINLASNYRDLKQEEKPDFKRKVGPETEDEVPVDDALSVKRLKGSSPEAHSSPSAAHDNHVGPSGARGLSTDEDCGGNHEGHRTLDTSNPELAVKDQGSEGFARKAPIVNPTDRQVKLDGELPEESNEANEGARGAGHSSRRSPPNSRDSEQPLADASTWEPKELDDSELAGGRPGKIDRADNRAAVSAGDLSAGSRHPDTSRSSGKRSGDESPSPGQVDIEAGEFRCAAQSLHASELSSGSPRSLQRESLERFRGGKMFVGGPGKAAGSDYRITFRPRAVRVEGGSRDAPHQQDCSTGRR